MSREQWGHGYSQGLKAKTKESLVDVWFHTFDACGNIDKRGLILRALGEGKVLAQRYTWITLEPAETFVADKSDVLNSWDLFASASDMVEAFENYPRRMSGKLGTEIPYRS
jgi:hypothetical protein